MSRNRLKALANRLLAPFNARLESLTAETTERRRLKALERRGQFDGPVYPLLPAFQRAAHEPVLDAVARFRARFDAFAAPTPGGAGYSFDNPYFSSPDAEVYYALLRTCAPREIVEIGSGNSSRVARQAILDGGLGTRLVSIDPSPRLEVHGCCDEVLARPVEEVDPGEIIARVGHDGCLFVDSSHILRTGTDLPQLFLRVVPALAPGALLHFHDVFLPYEYPRAWVLEERFGFNEQYLVHLMLAAGDRFEVLWPGHYLQRTLPGFARHFPHMGARLAASLWLRAK